MRKALLIGALLLIGSQMSGSTRGLRNHNPGNIRRSSDRWLGLAPVQTDPDYFQFDTPLYGLRAMARVLDNYARRHGLRTVRELIARWAPAGENPTAAYVDFVAGELGVSPDAPIDVTGRRAELIAAIVRFENGRQPYSPALIAEAVRLADA